MKNGLWNKNYIYKNNIPTIPIFDGASIDFDQVYKETYQGLTIFVVNESSINVPITDGMCFHIQRVSKGTITTSQQIRQIIYSHYGTCRRHGIGNGSEIIWSEWESE